MQCLRQTNCWQIRGLTRQKSNGFSGGFTIVELLIVIVVIGILAAIVIVAYNGIQAKAHDARRKSDVAEIAKGLKIYQTEHDDFIGVGSGCGSQGNGNGWFSYQHDTSYPQSISSCLAEALHTSQEIVDPSGAKACASNSKCYTYMKYNCGTSVYVLARMEVASDAMTMPNDTCINAAVSNFGMNYYAKVN